MIFAKDINSGGGMLRSVKSNRRVSSSISENSISPRMNVNVLSHVINLAIDYYPHIALSIVLERTLELIKQEIGVFAVI